jgi:acyl-CoA reductase-like NAD-dependent aldehyde dehydrogenase
MTTPAQHLVERLRHWHDHAVLHGENKNILWEAADAITAMQEQIDQTVLAWQDDKRTAEENLNNAQAAIKRLEWALKFARRWEGIADESRAEIARLREALEDFAEGGFANEEAIRHRARAALNEQQ